MVTRKINIILIIGIVILKCINCAYGETIALVPNEDYYIKAFRKFKEELKNKRINIDKTIIDTKTTTETTKTVETSKENIVITLGNTETIKALKTYPNIFFFMTADITILNKLSNIDRKRKIAGVFYIAEINKRLQTIRELFPNSYSIGLIYSKKSYYYANLIKQLADKKNIKINLYMANPDNFTEILENTIYNNDILWMIPDFNLYNYSNIKLTLVTAVKKAKPVITFSPVFLEGGAFLSYKIKENAYIKQAVNGFYNCFMENNCKIEFAQDFNIIINKNLLKFWKIKIPQNISNIILK